jgi:hypothetical protein
MSKAMITLLIATLYFVVVAFFIWIMNRESRVSHTWRVLWLAITTLALPGSVLLLVSYWDRIASQHGSWSAWPVMQQVGLIFYFLMFLSDLFLFSRAVKSFPEQKLQTEL